MASGNNNPYICRRAGLCDIRVVQEMIRELADLEQMSNGPKLTDQELIRDAGFNGGPEYCHIYVVELEREKSIKVTLGYAICFFGYSTWVGKSYFIEDIFIRVDYRGMGAGRSLFQHIASMAKQYNCKRLDFHVLGWNPAIAFYEKMGAKNITETEEWNYFRVDEEQIEKLTTVLDNQ